MYAIVKTGGKQYRVERGQTLLVEIVEPHMYDVDDAVAKIDGYIISIAGAASCVGEKRMVRIDEVGRTAASALLLDEAGEVVAAPARTPSKAPSTRAKRRLPSAASDAPTAESRSRRRPAAADSDDAEARQEAGLSEPPAGLDAEPEEELAKEALSEPSPETGEGGEDGLQSKPRRRGRRGGRRRSAAKAKATE